MFHKQSINNIKLIREALQEEPSNNQPSIIITDYEIYFPSDDKSTHTEPTDRKLRVFKRGID